MQLPFTELDKMEIYMFKIYQLTQAICYDAFINIIESLMNTYVIWTVIFGLVYGILLIFWIGTMAKEKKEMSKLYARLALIPFGILKGNPRMVNSFKEAI